jgi:thiol:disulfide interchange protein
MKISWMRVSKILVSWPILSLVVFLMSCFLDDRFPLMGGSPERTLMHVLELALFMTAWLTFWVPMSRPRKDIL